MSWHPLFLTPLVLNSLSLSRGPSVAMLIPKAHKVAVYSKLFNGECCVRDAPSAACVQKNCAAFRCCLVVAARQDTPASMQLRGEIPSTRARRARGLERCCFWQLTLDQCVLVTRRIQHAWRILESPAAADEDTATAKCRKAEIQRQCWDRIGCCGHLCSGQSDACCNHRVLQYDAGSTGITCSRLACRW